MARICILTAGHLATCPRMVKAADALSGAHEVRVVSTRHVAWATTADEAIRRAARWRWTVVPYDRAQHRRTYFGTGVRHRASRAVVDLVGVSRVPAGIAVRALSRAHDELVAAAVAEPADLFYGGTNGGIAAAAAAATRAGVRYGLDLEDFHSGEDAVDDVHNRIAERVERSILAGASFLTTASSAMADAYREKYGLDPVPVHNTFPLPTTEPDFSPRDASRLSLYWFGQTIGTDRGLQDAVRAVGLAGIRATLDIRGRQAAGAGEAIRQLGAAVAPHLALVFLPPSDPTAMVELCRGHDVGLSLELSAPPNRAVTLGNKTLTYPLAGLAVAVTDTPGQRTFAADLGVGALACRSGDVEALAAGLKRWADDPGLLCAARRAAWAAAQRRWHWEHPADRGALVATVERALA